MEPKDPRTASEAHLAAMRVRYVPGPLREEDVAAEPFAQFRSWLVEAVESGLPEPNALVLATCTPLGTPSSRLVLLKELDDSGFVFYTNTASRKSGEMAANAAVALCFPWFAIARQVTVEGEARPIERGIAEAYWATRPRESQLGAWASRQSQPVADRAALHAQLAEVERRFATSDPIPMPESWGGYRVEPSVVEFWQGQPGRMHDRLRYRRHGDGWLLERLQP
jgi:pyridoxamine 5'-phosphate oxidase